MGLAAAWAGHLCQRRPPPRLAYMDAEAACAVVRGTGVGGGGGPAPVSGGGGEGGCWYLATFHPQRQHNAWSEGGRRGDSHYRRGGRRRRERPGTQLEGGQGEGAELPPRPERDAQCLQLTQRQSSHVNLCHNSAALARSSWACAQAGFSGSCRSRTSQSAPHASYVRACVLAWRTAAEGQGCRRQVHSVKPRLGAWPIRWRGTARLTR